MHRTVRHAFTLIELLVVIAIIAMLIGLLIPGIGMARGAARQIVCLSNQREIFAAIGAYAQDNKDQHHAKRQNYGARFLRINGNGAYESGNLRILRPYVIDFSSDGPTRDYAYWGSLYDTYFNISIDPAWYTARMPWPSDTAPPFAGWKVWRCPSARGMDPYPYSDAVSGGTKFDPDHLYQTYGFNGVDDRRDPSTNRPAMTWWRQTYAPEYRRMISKPTRMTDIAQPFALIMFQDAFEHMIDSNGDTLNNLDQYNPNDDRNEPEFKNWKKEYFRHNTGCNTMWGDGHARSIGKVDMNDSLPWYTGLSVRQ